MLLIVFKILNSVFTGTINYKREQKQNKQKTIILVFIPCHGQTDTIKFVMNFNCPVFNVSL